MPIYSIQGPDGRIYDIEGPAGASDAQLIGVLKQQLMQPPPPKAGGVSGALGKGAESFGSSAMAGLQALLGSPEEAAAAARKREESIGARYEEGASLDKLKEAYEQQGLLAAGKELAGQIPKAIAEQAPNLAASLGGAATGARLGALAGPVGAVVGGGVGAFVPSFLPQLGGNIQRQAEEGQQVDLGKAVPSALAQGALDVAANFIPFGRQIVGTVMGKEVAALLEKGAAKGAEKLAEESLKKTIAKGTVVGAAAEVPTEITQQMLERWQAGLPLTSEDALKEYGQTAYQVGLLAPLGAVGRVADRGAARQQMQEQQRQKDAQAVAEQQRVQAEEAAKQAEFRKSPEYVTDLLARFDAAQKKYGELEAAAKGKVDPNDLAAVDEKKAAKQAFEEYKKSDELKAIRAERQQAGPAIKQVAQQKQQAGIQQELEAMRQQEGYQATLPGFDLTETVTPPAAPVQEEEQIDYARQLRLLNQQLDTLKQQNQAVTSLQQKVALGNQHAQIQDAIKAITPLAQAQETKAAPQRDVVADLIKEMQKADELGDIARSSKIAQRLNTEFGLEDLSQYTPQLTKQPALKTPAGGNVPLKELRGSETREEYALRRPQTFTPTEVLNEEELMLDQQRQDEEAKAAIEARRLEKVAPETAALKRIQKAKTTEELANRLADITGKEETGVEGSPAMGRTAQELQGKLPGPDLIHTALEKAPAPAPKVQKGPGGGFRLFNEQGEPQRPSDYKNISQRLASVLARPDLSTDAYNFLRRAEKVLPVFDSKMETARRLENKEGVYRDVAQTESVLNLLDKQLTRIEQGAEGTARKPAAPAKGTQKMLGFDVPTQRKVIEGPTAQAEIAGKPLSTQEELEPLVRGLERGAEDTNAGQGELFPETGAELGLTRKTRAAFIQAERSKAVQAEKARAAEEQAAIAEANKPAAVARREAAIAAAESVKRRDEINKLYQERLEAAYNEEARGQVYEALDEAQRRAREGEEIKLSKKEQNLVDKNPNDVLGGYRSTVRRLERKIKAAETSAKEMLVAELLPLQEKVDRLQTRYLGAKGSGARDQLGAALDKARSEYDAAVDRVTTQQVFWKGRQKDIDALAEAYRKTDWLEEQINSGRIAAPEDRVPKEYKLRMSAADKERLGVTKKKEEVAEATFRASAPATSGESLTKAQIAKRTKPQKTLYSSKGVGPITEDMDKKVERLRKEAEAAKEEKEILDYLDQIGKKLQENKVLNAFEEAFIVQRSKAASVKRNAKGDYDAGVEFSMGAAKNGLTANALQTELDTAIGGKGLTQSKVGVFNSVEDFYSSTPDVLGDYPDLPANAKAFVDPKTGKAYMFANNIGAGEGLGVFLHEVGAHLGFRNLFNKAQYGSLVKAVKTWASKNDGSLESSVAKAAIDRVESAKTSAEQYDDELLAYAVEEAVKAGTTPSAMKGGAPIKNWLSTVMNLLKKALAKFGINPAKLTAGDLVNLAYGAAQLEVRGTWHGSDATFKAFDTKYAGAGEGVFDKRFEGNMSLGKGPYTTPDKAYGEYYQHAIPFGKAANETGYGNKSYQDFRDMDETFMSAQNQDLSYGELKSKFESSLLTEYVTGVAHGDSLDPAKSASVQRFLKERRGYYERALEETRNRKMAVPAAKTPDREALIEDAKKRREAKIAAEEKVLKAFDTLDPARIKGFTERPTPGNLYRTLDDIPREKVFNVNSEAVVGERPAIDALREQYGKTFITRKDGTKKDVGLQDGKYPLNGLFYKMRKELGIEKTIQLLKDAGIEVIEQNNDRRYVERAYIDNAPEILGMNLEPVGSAKGLLFSKAPASSIVGYEPGKLQTLKENMYGLAARVQLVDRLAAADEGIVRAEGAGKLSSMEAFNAQYFMRLADNVTQAAGQFITHGPVRIVSEKTKEGTEYRYEAQQGATLTNMSEQMELAAKAGKMSPEETERLLTVQAAGQRAEATPNGWARLLSDNPAAAKAEYAKDNAYLTANPEVKKHIDAALKEYKTYNDGLIDFTEQCDFLSKEEADRLKKLPYVPFYRISDGDVKLFIDKEHAITIGSIADNPDLKRLLGDNQKILPILSSAVQNTFMLTRAAMKNKATLETSAALYKAGFASKLGTAQGPANADTVHYKYKGKPAFATIDTDTFGIPANLVVKGMEGIKTSIPALVQMMGMPANMLRKFITRNPAYAVRQLVRDPVNAFMLSGVDGVPIVNALREMKDMKSGRSDAEEALMRGLAISSNVYSGNEEDMKMFLRDVSAGKGKWDKLMGTMDTLALQADAATRATIYRDSIAKGMSVAQAQFRAMESQNFSRRGLSPSMQMLSTMIPFFNAQIQGLDVLYRSLTGKMPFAKRLDIQRKIKARGMLLGAGAMAYALMMSDDDEYRKASPEERYGNFFIRLPGVEAPLKLPVPFEIGVLFMGIPQAIVDTAMSDTKGAEAVKGISKLLWQSAPGVVPAGAKPFLEAAYGQTLYGPIESPREKESLQAGERYRPETTEVAKQLGAITGEVGVSPLMLEHLVKGYTGSLGISMLHMLDPLFGDIASKVPTPANKMPFVGGLFQTKDGRFLIDRAYERMDDVMQAKGTYEALIQKGERARAEAFAQRYSNLLAQSDVAGSFKQRMGEMFADERAIQNNPNMTSKEKEDIIKRIKDAENTEAKAFFAATERTTPR